MDCHSNGIRYGEEPVILSYLLATLVNMGSADDLENLIDTDLLEC